MEKEKSKQSRQSGSKESKTSSNPDPSKTEISLTPETPQPEPPLNPDDPDTIDPEVRKKIDQILGSLADAYDLAKSLTDEKSDLDRMSQEILRILNVAGDDDALLSYDIRFSAKSGEVFNLRGNHTLHSFSSQEMLGEGPRNFEALLYTALFRPMKSRVQKYLNTFVKNDNPVDNILPLGTGDQQPEIREAGFSTFITDGD